MAESIWTPDFWRATAERCIRTGAQAGLLTLGQDAYESLQVDALHIDWMQLVGFVLGGVLLALLFSLAGNVVSRTGPSFTQAEVAPDSLEPPVNPGV